MNEGKKSRFKQAAQRWWQALDSPLAFILVVFTLAAVYFGVVDWRVRTIVEDPEFVAEVARHARPGLVFDADGRILADMGALQFLEDVPVVELVLEDGEDSYVKITVRPKGYLSAQPVVEALDTGAVSVRAERGPGLSWEIRLSRRYSLVSAGGQPADVSPPRYRLEIVPP